MGIDRFLLAKVTTQRGARFEYRKLWLSVEYKGDAVAEKTGNFFVELDLRDSSGNIKPGWALKIMAQSLLLLFPSRRVVWWIDVLHLKQLIPSWLGLYHLSPWVINRDGVDGRGVLVPLSEIRRGCVYDVESLRG